MHYKERELGDQKTDNRVKGLVKEVRTMLGSKCHYIILTTYDIGRDSKAQSV